MVDGGSLSAEEPEWCRGVVDGDTESGKLSGSRDDRLEHGIHASFGSSHDRAWIGKRRLGDGVVFGAELKMDSVTRDSRDTRRAECQTATISNKNLVV